MAIDHGVILSLYLLATVVSLALSIVVWRHREKPGAIPLAICLCATALYSGPLVVASAVDDFAVSQQMVRLLYVGVVISVMILLRSRSLYRGQAAAVLGATLIPLITSVADVIGLFDFDPTPIGFLLAGILFTVAILRYQLIDILPIARDRVLDTVSDGVFVVDTRDRLIDANPAGRALIEDIEGSPIGTDVDSLFDGLPELRDEYHDLTARQVGAERERTLLGGHYHVRTTPIEDDRDRHVGWLFIVRDITERKRRETQLQRQNECLERFADVVSHDLRNPLNVADGYVELAREADDPEPSLDEVERSHDRMASIIEDVLALARDGGDVTDPAPTSLAAVAEAAWENVDTGEATLAIVSDATVLADADRVTRLLENLFRNSIEHGTPDGTEAGDESARSAIEVEVGRIEASAGDRSTGFYVADDGRGLPADSDRVFEDGYTTDPDGTGFGLTIAEGIATAHGWTVTAGESERGGARFEFRGIDSPSASSPTDPVSGADIEPDSLLD
ncbi:ATP-binding protein [Natrinema zhouii]|uniref:histidine kinase n=1 Tax=Natrinema zhouii TaxID=1710539 RepID=A0A7D6GKJ1_9EURY|nr:histidine kinase N-terminal 7TM domain-containing protein [Natrinema zhouii]QLK26160.1 ATP-binding protein [Natrinema zhouii]